MKIKIKLFLRIKTFFGGLDFLNRCFPGADKLSSEKVFLFYHRFTWVWFRKQKKRLGRAHSLDQPQKDSASKNQSWNFKTIYGARNRLGIWLSYRPARLHRMADLIPWNRFLLGSINVKNGLRSCPIQHIEHRKWIKLTIGTNIQLTLLKLYISQKKHRKF